MKKVLAVLAAAAAAGCGGGNDVGVVFLGQTPTNSLAKDTRAVEFRCPFCGAALDASGGPVQRCSNRDCGARISWRKPDRTCGYCDGSGVCPTCRMMNQENGDCYNCRGMGFLTLYDKTSPCKNCGGQKKCPMCKGRQECDFCGGDGQVTLDEARERVKPPAPATPEH